MTTHIAIFTDRAQAVRARNNINRHYPEMRCWIGPATMYDRPAFALNTPESIDQNTARYYAAFGRNPD